LAGTTHGAQAAPHEFTLEFGAQAPPQSCVIAGHWFVQAFCIGMHVPAHTFWPPGQVTPHLVPSQLAVPPVGGAQAVHEVPHVCGSRLLAHAFPHWWVPDGHEHIPLTQTPPAAQSLASQQSLDGMH
jgi:hypothetical protein